jgi:hypothetical protein
MRPPVFPEHFVAEVLHPQTQTGDPQFLQLHHFRLGQGARFALERHLLRPIPVDALPQAGDQRVQLADAQERGRPAAEIDEPERPVAHGRLVADQLDLPRQGADIGLDVAGTIVGKDLEVAEFAAFPAERDVQVQAQRHVAGGCCSTRSNSGN